MPGRPRRERNRPSSHYLVYCGLNWSSIAGGSFLRVFACWRRLIAQVRAFGMMLTHITVFGGAFIRVVCIS